MNNSALPFQNSERASLPLVDLESCIHQWLLDCEIRQNSQATIANRTIYTSNLIWFLRLRKHACCGKDEMRAFLHYVTTGHRESGGRWGRANETEPVKASTVQTYHSHLRALFNWIVEEGRLDVSPMKGLRAPISREDQVQPFSPQQVDALIRAARASDAHKLRNEAIVLVLYDTGIRNTELCTLLFKNLDMTLRRITVIGKGGKRRSVHFSPVVARILWKYLAGGRELEDCVFRSERGDCMTKDGLSKLFHRMGIAAGITDVRCSPHTMRHSFAVEFLRAGGNQFALMQILGHEDMKMTARYVKLAEADIERQQRQFSPASRLKGKGIR